MLEPSQLLSFLTIFTPEKKREGIDDVSYFLKINNPANAIAAIITTTMIAINSVAMNGASATCVGSASSSSIACVGEGGSDTRMAVSEYDLKYDSEPSNVAYIVYLPGTGGSQSRL